MQPPRIIAWEKVEQKDDNISSNSVYIDSGDGEEPHPYVFPDPSIKIKNSLGIVNGSFYEFDTDSLNLWIGHTNFKLTKCDVDTIRKVDGVEILEILTRYRVRVGVAKLFDAATTLSKIGKALNIESLSPTTNVVELDAKIKHVATKVSSKYTFWFVYSNNGKNKAIGCDTLLEYKELVSVYRNKPGFVYTYLGETFEKTNV